MSGNFTKRDILKWIEVIYRPGNKIIQDTTTNWLEYKNIFIDQVAENLYKDIQRTQHLFTSPYTFRKDFNKLPENERPDKKDGHTLP